jgi:ferritin
MKLSEDLYQLLNNQVTLERFNSNCYREMEIAFNDAGWLGFANWAHIQSQYERRHSQFLISYLGQRGRPAHLLAIAEPPVFVGQEPLDIMNAALDLEKNTTQKVVEIYYTALDQKDLFICQFIMWFVGEQSRSEGDVHSLIDRLSNGEPTDGTVRAIDRELRKLAEKNVELNDIQSAQNDG